LFGHPLPGPVGFPWSAFSVAGVETDREDGGG